MFSWVIVVIFEKSIYFSIFPKMKYFNINTFFRLLSKILVDNRKKKLIFQLINLKVNLFTLLFIHNLTIIPFINIADLFLLLFFRIYLFITINNDWCNMRLLLNYRCFPCVFLRTHSALRPKYNNH